LSFLAAGQAEASEDDLGFFDDGGDLHVWHQAGFAAFHARYVENGAAVATDEMVMPDLVKLVECPARPGIGHHQQVHATEVCYNLEDRASSNRLPLLSEQAEDVVGRAVPTQLLQSVKNLQSAPGCFQSGLVKFMFKCFHTRHRAFA
jgi:hypothetical protein